MLGEWLEKSGLYEKFLNLSDGWQIAIGIGIIVGVAMLIDFIIEVIAIPGKKKNQKTMAYLSGRAEGKILKRDIVKHESKPAGRGGNGDVSNYTECYVTYEFVADGITYTGRGKGSGNYIDRNSQIICYDPQNPDDNCTLYYYKDHTEINVLKSVLYAGLTVILGFVMIIGIVKLICWLTDC